MKVKTWTEKEEIRFEFTPENNWERRILKNELDVERLKRKEYYRIILIYMGYVEVEPYIFKRADQLESESTTTTVEMDYYWNWKSLMEVAEKIYNDYGVNVIKEVVREKVFNEVVKFLNNERAKSI